MRERERRGGERGVGDERYGERARARARERERERERDREREMWILFPFHHSPSYSNFNHFDDGKYSSTGVLNVTLEHLLSAM